jgi:hypothetical protein
MPCTPLADPILITVKGRESKPMRWTIASDAPPNAFFKTPQADGKDGIEFISPNPGGPNNCHAVGNPASATEYTCNNPHTNATPNTWYEYRIHVKVNGQPGAGDPFVVND